MSRNFRGGAKDESVMGNIAMVEGEHFLFRRDIDTKHAPGSEGDEKGEGIIPKGATSVCIIACPMEVTQSDLCKLGEIDSDALKYIHVLDDLKRVKRMVLLTFKNEDNACMFIERSNGARFRDNHEEICHAVFLRAIHVLPSGKPLPMSAALPLLEEKTTKGTPPTISGGSMRSGGGTQGKDEKEGGDGVGAGAAMPVVRRLGSKDKPLSVVLPDKGYFELPTCSMCLERLDSCVSGLLFPRYPSSSHKHSNRWSSVRCTVCEGVMLYTHTTLLAAKAKNTPKKSVKPPACTATAASPRGMMVPPPSQGTLRAEVPYSGPDRKDAGLAWAAERAREVSSRLRIECKECNQAQRSPPPKEGGVGIPEEPETEGSVVEREEERSMQGGGGWEGWSEGDPPWICLVCGHIGCGRFQNSHAVRHYERTGHRFSLFPKSEAIWDYAGDGYVHRLLRHKTRGFEQRYVATGELEGGAAGAATAVKLKAISGHYNHLLKVLLRQQQQQYMKEVEAVHACRRAVEEAVEEERKKSAELKEELHRVEKLTRIANKKNSSTQSKIAKETEQVRFLQTLNDTLIKGQKEAKDVGEGTSGGTGGRRETAAQDYEKKIGRLREEVARLMKQLDDGA